MSFPYRPATSEDAAAIADLVHAFDRAFLDDPERLSEQDVLDWWQRLADGEAIVVEAPGGAIAAHGSARRRGSHLEADNYVHPAYMGRGIGSQLVDWSEGLAREQGFETIRVAVLTADAAARCLLEARGFHYIRSYYRMLIDLDGPPGAPQWPRGLEPETLRPGEEQTLYEVIEEAFADHWGHEPRTFEEWSRQQRIEPELCFVVRDGGEVAAAELCNEARSGMGWVGTLAVRRAWRRQGLGRALLLHAFAELHARGQSRIGLGVDAENTTGAVGLYERAGMRVAWQADLYEKALSGS